MVCKINSPRLTVNYPHVEVSDSLLETRIIIQKVDMQQPALLMISRIDYIPQIQGEASFDLSRCAMQK